MSSEAIAAATGGFGGALLGIATLATACPESEVPAVISGVRTSVTQIVYECPIVGQLDVGQAQLIAPILGTGIGAVAAFAWWRAFEKRKQSQPTP